MIPSTQTSRKSRSVVKSRSPFARKRLVVTRAATINKAQTNRIKLESFLRAKGVRINFSTVPLWHSHAIDAFGFIVEPPMLAFRSYRNINGTLSDFIAHFNRHLKWKHDFNPEQEFFLMLLNQMKPRELSMKDANSVMSRIGDKKVPGRKIAEDTKLILRLHREQPKMSHGKIAEVVITKRFPNKKLRPIEMRDLKQTYRPMVAKILAYHRRASAAKKRGRNHFWEPQQLICVFRTDGKFFIVESSGDDPPE